MALATWWTADPQMDLAPVAGFQVRLANDDAALAHITHLTHADIQGRRRGGHRPYVGSLGDTPVAYGWVATRAASIGELALVFPLPTGDRYLWDAATLPAWHEHGLYPRLLQASVRAEEAERFWILHTPENLASGAETQNAGFQAVGQLAFRPDGTVGLIPIGLPERARIGAALLGVPLLKEGRSPCWRCMDRVACTCQ